MGFPMRKAAGRAALIAVMLGGGLLYAGLSQAQDAGEPAAASQAERAAELAAAAGGPAPDAHLAAFPQDAPAVELRDDDVAAEAAAPPAKPPPSQAVMPAARTAAAQPVAVTYATAPGSSNRK